jgi:NADH-quinone oxidoreductase subunit M
MVPLLVLIVFLGIYPKPVLDRIEPSVDRILDRMEQQVDDYDQPRTQGGAELGPIVVEEHSDHGDEGEHAAADESTTEQPATEGVAP